jgi:hypothetical protein
MCFRLNLLKREKTRSKDFFSPLLTVGRDDLSDRSSLGFAKGILPEYFSSERSQAQLKVPEDVHTIAGFGADNYLIGNATYISFIQPR